MNILRSLCLLFLSACATQVGSRSLPAVRFNYTQALAQSAEEQMLLNFVRLRHSRLPVFLQVSSVVTQYGLSTNLGVGGAYSAVASGGFVPPASANVSGGVRIEERPTITYTPLHGEDFVRRLATPLTSETIGSLVQAGWPWEAILSCCVQQVNGLYAPTDPRRSTQSGFSRLGYLLSQLQAEHIVSIRNDKNGGKNLVFAIPRDQSRKEEAEEVRRLLGLDPTLYHYRLASGEREQNGSTVNLYGRSLMDILYYLSQGVDAEDQLRPLLGKDALLHIQATDRAPKKAYAVVEHDEKFYFIGEGDAQSQGLFVLVAYLFSLMSTPAGNGPIVTVGAGG